MCAKSLHSCPTLHDPMDCSPLGSSVHGILQPEYWSGLPCPTSKVSLWLRDRTHDLASLTSQGLATEFCTILLKRRSQNAEKPRFATKRTEGLFTRKAKEETDKHISSLPPWRWGPGCIYGLRNTATGHSEAWAGVGVVGYGGRWLRKGVIVILPCRCNWAISPPLPQCSKGHREDMQACPVEGSGVLSSLN